MDTRQAGKPAREGPRYNTGTCRLSRDLLGPKWTDLRKDSRGAGPGTGRTPRTPAPGPGVGVGVLLEYAGKLHWLVGLQSPARGANHLCHTVTIILHKIIIKNPNFSDSNPASGLLAFSSAGVCGPVITGSLPPSGADPPALAIKH